MTTNAGLLLNTQDDFDFFNMLDSGDAGQASVVIDALHGLHGAQRAKNAAKTLSQGVGFGGDFDVVLPIADYLLMQGHLDTVIALVEAGPAEAALLEWGLPAQATLTKVQWLDLLCTTQGKNACDQPKSFLSTAVWRSLSSYSEDLRMAALRAIEYVWHLDRDHPGFESIAAQSSPEGDVMRAFLSWKRCTKVKT